MARYTRPKGRVNRRLSTPVYESAGSLRALERRNQPPGMHVRPKRPSNYGQALMEKQKIKHYYGLGERQLRRFFDKASRLKGGTGVNMLLLCERRLDNVVRRAGLTKTRPQARQGAAHGHFQVNGVKVDRPSFLLRPGDVITVRPREGIRNLYRAMIEQGIDSKPVDWLSFDAEGLTITVLGNPGPEDVSLPVDVNMVVEFMSR